MADNNTVFVKLDEEQFRDLVAGREAVTTNTNGRIAIKLILADIGWDRMKAAIQDAEREQR